MGDDGPSGTARRQRSGGHAHLWSAWRTDGAFSSTLTRSCKCGAKQFQKPGDRVRTVRGKGKPGRRVSAQAADHRHEWSTPAVKSDTHMVKVCIRAGCDQEALVRRR